MSSPHRAVLLSMAFVAACSSPLPTPTQTQSPMLMPTGTPTRTPGLTATPSRATPSPSSPPLSLLGGSWSDPVRLPGAGVVTGVASDGSELVAIGVAQEPDGQRAVFWRSADGIAWTRIPDQSDFADVVLRAVAAGGPGFVAVGWIGKPYGPNPVAPERDAVVFTSADGWTWVQEAEGPWAADAVMSDVAVGPGGLIAVGGTQPAAGADTSAGICGAALAWTSADGHNWGRSAIGSQDMCSNATRVAVGPAGFMAMGSTRPRAASSSEPQRIIWSSPDGVSWSPMAVPDLADVRSIYGMGSGPGGLVMFAQTGDDTGGAAWQSADGLTWSSIDATVFAGPPGVHDDPGGAVLGWVGGYLIMSLAGSEIDGHRFARVWLSEDGTDWREVVVPSFGVATPSAFAFHRNQLVAVGGRGGLQPAAWVSPAVGPAPPPPPPSYPLSASEPMAIGERSEVVRAFMAGGGALLALGGSPPTVDGRVWRSTDDGVSWRPVESDILAGAALQAGSWTDAGFVVVGYELNAREDGRMVRAPTAWTSADGLTWQRHAMGPPSDKPGFEEAAPLKVVSGGPGFIAIGRSLDSGSRCGPDSGVIWASTDGAAWERSDDSDLECARLVDIIATDEGLLAIGARVVATNGQNFSQTLVWRSEGGVDWQTPTVVPMPAMPTAIAEGPGGLMLVGAVDSGPSIILRSAEGREWIDSGYVPPIQSFTEFFAVAAGSPGGFLVAGQISLSQPGDFFSNAAAWSSADGLTWSRVLGDPQDLAPGVHFASAAIWTGQSFVVGGTTSDGQPVTWRLVPD